jgi:hypothetical protein
MPVHDFYGNYQGYLDRKDTRKPKALTFCGDYCRLHFPVNSTNKTKLVIVEDIVSAEILAQFVPTAAVLGSYISKKQVDYLLACGVTDLCICLDDDAKFRASKLVRELSLLFRTYFINPIPDPKDMNHYQLDTLVDKIKVLYDE